MGADPVVRVRFAPSPTGYLHIGNARTALFNWLFARKVGGRFILRIEDTDPERSRREFVDALLEDLRWLGLEWDEGPEVGGPFGPYFQSQRKQLYDEHLQRLLQEGRAFYCFCPPGQAPRIDWGCREVPRAEAEERISRGEHAVIRFRTPHDRTITFRDLLRGEVRFPGSEVGDFSIYRSDGMPLYNFSVVVDDALMRITHVIRGEDHLSNTPKQLLLYEAFGYEPPQFLHLPLILGSDGAPLSKRHGATSVRAYREMGFLPEALVNYLALLGWNPGTEEEIMTPCRILELFRLEDLNDAPARFSWDRLRWMNGKHLRALPEERLARLFAEWLRRAGQTISDEEAHRLVPLYRERVFTLSELVEKTKYLFEEPEIPDELREKYLTDPQVVEALRQLRGLLEETPFEKEALETAIRGWLSEHGLKPRKVLQPLRVVLTGTDASPGIFELMAYLGKETVLRRLDRFFSRIPA